MASTDSRPVPIKNVAFRLTFALRLNTGGLNSGAAGLDSEISKDGGTFVDCTNEATEIAASSGIYYLDLTAAEMNCDCVAIVVKSSTSGAITPEFILYPANAAGLSIPADVQAVDGDFGAAQRQSDLLLSTVYSQTDNGTYAATTTDFETNILVSKADDFYKGRSIVFVSGNLNQQACRITGSTYTGNNKMKISVTALTAAPTNASLFYIL